MRYLLTLFAILSIAIVSFSQKKQSFIGAGNNQGISVSSSNSAKLYEGEFTASDENTINGEGLIAKKIEAARFLSQATFGANPELVQTVADIGIEKWLTKQFNTPASNLSKSIQEVYTICFDLHLERGRDSISYPTRPQAYQLDYAWWDMTIRGDDLLRQRMAYALSEILVISTESNIGGYGLAMANYYDILLSNAFGNYRDILGEISKHPAMGVYLSHLNNAKSNEDRNTFPDENFAREIMQLFSIGLNMLNDDGSLKLDNDGKAIPTYDNDDIKEFAKIFTGFGIGARKDGEEPEFWNSIYIADVTKPMLMHEDYHEEGPKYLLNGYTIPGGQTGVKDVEDALDHLFNHPNVGPFICLRLIQHFIKSNPTPGYIENVVKVFNNDGNDVRGNMQAVLKAILMHPEARDCEWISNAAQGKLKEPILRVTGFTRQFAGTSSYDKYWNYSYNLINDLDQHPLHSPTVFNFFNPFYSPNGPLGDADLMGPEFEIHDSRTSINFANHVYYWVEWEYLLVCRADDVPEGSDNVVPTDLSNLMTYAHDADVLLDHLDIYLCNGQMSDRTRGIIKETINKYDLTLSGAYSRIQLATYLILISPDFTILN